jgi:molybdenum cofactor cytidylyltransferase
MKFGEESVRLSQGAILAHSVDLDGAGRLRKGVVLGARELEKLEAAGHEAVVVARLEPGDLGEDPAAAQIAAALVPDAQAAGLVVGAAARGRVNIHAACAGILQLDVARLHAANLVDPMITLATLPAFQRVSAGMLVATVKIIAYGVRETAVTQVGGTRRDAMTVAPVKMRHATLIQTRLSPRDDVLALKGEAAVAARLQALGITLSGSVRCDHRVEAIAAEMARAEGDIVLVLTASATSDPNDVAPAALRVAGGEVTRFGMPVDPGNLLFLGALAGRDVIGLPSCVRAPALNGADWVLERVVCGLAPSDDDIAAMGVGGLLKESPQRGHPREA